MPTVNEKSAIITLTSGAGAYLVGAWTLVIASALRDTAWSLLYNAQLTIPGGTDLYLDLAIGEISSEVIILNDAHMPMSATTDYNDSYQSLSLPLRFQEGDRISARVKDESGSAKDYHFMLRNFE